MDFVDDIFKTILQNLIENVIVSCVGSCIVVHNSTNLLEYVLVYGLLLLGSFYRFVKFQSGFIVFSESKNAIA